MRISRFGLPQIGAMLVLLYALPCLGQPATATIVVKTIQAKQGQTLSIRQTAQKAPQKELRGNTEKAPATTKGKAAVKAKIASEQGRCLTLRVYRFPKGFPEGNAKARPQVSDCTNVSLFQMTPLGNGTKAVLRH